MRNKKLNNDKRTLSFNRNILEYAEDKAVDWGISLSAYITFLIKADMRKSEMELLDDI